MIDTTAFQPTVAGSANTARHALRQATDAAHQRLHAAPAFERLLRDELSRTDYIQLLLRLYGLHVPIEARVSRFAADPLMAWQAQGDVAPRPDRLRADLIALGVTEATIRDSATADALLPACEDVATALGCAWVMEGSALGGRVLSRHLAPILGPDATEGGRFFASQPGQAVRWAGCCEAIEACGADPVRRAAMLASAAATFDAVAAWLA
jgi:heme oxygenase